MARRVESQDINGLLAKLCSAMEVGVVKYFLNTIKRPVSDMGCLARVKLGKMDVVVYYIGTLSYWNIHKRPRDHRIFWKVAQFVCLKDFQTCSGISEK